MAGQSIRVSQMVLTWGPGAVVETNEGPRVVLLPDVGLFAPERLNPEEFEISSQHLSVLLGSRRVFQIPSDSILSVRLGRPPGDGFWRTKPFPDWKLCEEHGRLYRTYCPVCREHGRRSRGHAEAVRFVLACPEGHLDDVDWDRVVHGDEVPHRPEYYYWEGGGGSLAEIRVKCPQCRKSARLSEAYGKTWPCSGRYPEREAPGEPPARSGDCTRGARIVQRQASNLRIPEIRTVFTVPPPYTGLHQLLSRAYVRDIIRFACTRGLIKDGQLDRAMLDSALRSITERPGWGAAQREEIMRCPDREIVHAIQDVLSFDPARSFEDLLGRELETFVRGARDGVPPIMAARPTSRILLEIDPNRSHSFEGPSRRMRLRAVAVTRLHAVTVQIGYRRQVESPASDGFPRLVEIAFSDSSGQEWVPGFEGYGEGIFVTVDSDEGWCSAPHGDASNAWFSVFTSGRADYPHFLFRSETREELHPAFVWWHTLSHLLIRVLSAECGYSAASIRERVYVQFDNAAAGRVRGGVLLYTTGRGSAGTLGGLVSMVPMIDRFVNKAVEMAKVCSADPLCIEQRFRRGHVLGAACHACCLVSETSCEHRNFWLDRSVLLENMP